MTEEIKNEVMDTVEEKALVAADAMEKAVADVVAQPSNGIGGKIVLGVGCAIGGFGAGYAFDRWVAPWIGKTYQEAKAKRAAKKAAKAAKKAEKNAKKAPTPAENNVPAENDETKPD